METTLTYYYLGSWTTITDEKGSIEQEASFDAWGNIRSASDWTSPMSEKLLFDRGYTGHEHLYFYGRMPGSNPSTDLSLINMNGRMYDPIMSSFLSVDNYVQSPENSQNFNRYAYCLNNPLKYTDPDGEWFLTGGLGFGKYSNGEYGITSASVGLNFGLFGFGVNFGFDSGLSSVGLYGEVGPHIGCAGVTGTLSVDYNFGSNTLTTSVAANCGISLDKNNTFNLGLGLSGFCSYNTMSDNATFGWGCHAGLGLNGDVGGAGIGASYSRCNGQNNFGLGLSGYREMPNAVYDFGVRDNLQTKESYCFPGAMEAIMKVLGSNIALADVWARWYMEYVAELAFPRRSYRYLHDEVSHSRYHGFNSKFDVVDVINSSPWANAKQISPDVDALINAYNNGQKVLVATEIGNERGHFLMVNKVEVYSKCNRIYFSETSPVRHVPIYVNEIGWKSSRNFNFYSIKLKQ